VCWKGLSFVHTSAQCEHGFASWNRALERKVRGNLTFLSHHFPNLEIEYLGITPHQAFREDNGLFWTSSPSMYRWGLDRPGNN
jgi:hypothetical protein